MPVATALLLGLVGLVLVLAWLRPGLGVVAAVVLVLSAPIWWWRWRTRRFRKALAALRNGKPADAREELTAFLEEIRGDRLFQRVQPWFTLGRRVSHEAAARSNLGVARLQEGDPERALGHFRRAAELDPESPQAAFGAAAALRRLGRYEDAEAAAERAVELRPTYLPARLVLAAVRRARGDREGAERALEPLREEGRDPDALLRRMEAQWPEADGTPPAPE